MNAIAVPEVVVWHDVECGPYTADLPLWCELAERERGPVLDVGAGTGRVALALARAGHAVTALDHDGALLAELVRRARPEGLEIPTVVAGAEGFDLAGARFGLVIVPMQTVQLLADRAAFLAAARRHLPAGGLLAIAIADALESFDPESLGLAALPAPDAGERDGWRFYSHPVAVRRRDGATRIERVRHAIAPDGERRSSADAIDLADLEVAGLEAEGRAAGLRPGARAPDRADRRARRLRGGAAACLNRSCACARCTPT